MNTQTMQDELSAAQGLLEATSSGQLAYTVDDGTPRVIPVGYYWTGEQFVVATGTEAPKVKAMRAHPDVALNIDSGGTPGSARALSVRGRADITIVDGVVTEYLQAAQESMDPDAYEEFAAGCRAMYPQQARIAITPTWARFYDFGVGRFPRFLAELAERASSSHD